jgi:carbonic anhydrase
MNLGITLGIIKDLGVTMDHSKAIRRLSRLLLLACLSLAALAQTTAPAMKAKAAAECDKHPLYAYDHGPNGQSTWCGVCNNAAQRHFQAPINIPEGKPNPALPAIRFMGYDQPTSLKTTLENPNNLKLYTPVRPPLIEIPGLGRYDLEEFHFHRPSEEAVSNHRYPMVIHLVHKKAGCVTGQCAVVISVLVEEGQPTAKTSAVLKVLFARFPPPAADGGTPVEIDGLLPADHQNAGYYTFPGSLTTPPCTEGITFFVLKTPIKFSAAEIEEFARRYPLPNARDIQELNGRTVENR